MRLRTGSLRASPWHYGLLAIGTALCCLTATVAAQEGARVSSESATSPSPAELSAYLTAYNMTARIAYLLDQISNAESPADEDAVLAQIRPLLHPDVTVVSDGQSYTGREIVLEGMRIVHARIMRNSTRLETSPTILQSDLDGSPPAFTIGTVQQHWWEDPATRQRMLANRRTELAIERVGSEWLVKRNVLQTVTGPVAQ